MWIWLCRHRTHLTSVRSIFVYNRLRRSSLLWTVAIVSLNLTRCATLSCCRRKQGINKLTSLYVCIYIYIDKICEEILFKRLLYVGGLTAVFTAPALSQASSKSHSLRISSGLLLNSDFISVCNSKPLPVRNRRWSRITQSNSSNKSLYHWRIQDWRSTFSVHNMNCSVLVLTDSKVLSSGIWRLVHSVS